MMKLRLEVLEESRERKDWFIPASKETRALHRQIDRALSSSDEAKAKKKPSAKTSPLQGPFSRSSSEDHLPEKVTNFEIVRDKVRQEAAEAREVIPPEYKAEPYPEDVPKIARMAGVFNTSSEPLPGPPSSRDPVLRP